MKRQLFAAVTVLATLMVGGSALAQELNVKVSIPFNFVVQGQTLPAGSYSLRSITRDGKTLMVESADRQERAMINIIDAESLKPADHTKLVFHRYEDRYFLSQVWIAGNNRGRQLPKSAREAEVAMDYPAQNVVLIAAAR
jgi:hypothetical protein